MQENMRIKRTYRSGQVMVLTTMIIGGILMSASVVAGFLMFNQIKQSNDAPSSGMALFAADAGIENALNCYFFTENRFNLLDFGLACDVSGTLPNNSRYETNLECQKNEGGAFVTTPCKSADVIGFKVVSRGFSGNTERSLETFIFTNTYAGGN